jgi:hypothetical protein
MHSPSGSSNPAVHMIVKRLVAAGVLLWLGAALASCSPFAGYMADRWPHWAGGLPPDAPPRPGAPGYDEFIAHGEAPPAAAQPVDASTTGTAPAGAAATSVQPGKSQNGKAQVGRVQSAPAQANVLPPNARSEAPVQAEPSDNPPAEDTSVVRGGLY